MGNTNSSDINFESGKLISFDENNKIVFNNILNSFNNLESKCIVLSMIGCARVGKSTFINGFLSYLFNKNIHFVKTTNGGDHCTIGIDYINFPYNQENNNVPAQIIILDCQGLMYEDSKNDDKMLSIIYSLSDIIVYHDTGIINNQTLNALTSLCLVADQIKDNSDAKEIKPMLFFRMRDYDLECSPDKIIQKTFKKQKDQYDKVRGAINKLFPVIGAIFTDPLGKKEKKELSNGNYMSILNDNEYGFNNAYNEILQCIQNINIKTVGSLCKHANTVVAQINDNAKISFNDYDYYTLLIEKRFGDYWSNIDSSIYLTIVPTCKEITYEKCVNRLNDMNNEIKKFQESFSEVEQTMLDEEICRFKAKIEPHILETMKQCDNMAQNEINNMMQEIISNCIAEFGNSDYTYNNMWVNGNRIGIQNKYEKYKYKEIKTIDVVTNFIINNDQNTYINSMCRYLLKSKLCKVTLNNTKVFLTNQMTKICNEISQKMLNENILFESVNKKCIELLDTMANISYLENKIKEIKIFIIDCNEHFLNIQQNIKNEITQEIKGKFLTHRLKKIVYKSSNNTIDIEWSSRDDNYDGDVYNGSDDKELFADLFGEITKRIDEDFFTTKRDQLKQIYVQHTKSQLSQQYINIDMMKEQSLISFTILYFLIDDEKIVIIKKILDTLQFDIEFIKNRDNKYCCYQLSENAEHILNFLCDYINLKHNYITVEMMTCTRSTVCPSNIKTYVIDFNKLFGEIFLTRIINKYVDLTYSNY